MEELKRRKIDNGMYRWLPKLIYTVVIIVSAWTIMQVTVSQIQKTVELQAEAICILNPKVNTLEANYANIKETLNKMERKIDRLLRNSDR